MSIRGQLNEFLKDDEKNIFDFKIKGFTPQSISLTFLEDMYQITINLNQDMTFNVASDDEDLCDFCKTVNKGSPNEKRLSKLLENIVDTYSQVTLTPTPREPKTPSQIFGTDDPEEDGEEELGEEFILEPGTPMRFYHDEVFDTPGTQHVKDRHKKQLELMQQKQFAKTVKTLEISDALQSMTHSAVKDWRKRDAQSTMYVTFYTDGFVVEDEGILRAMDHPENRKILEEFKRGRVPNQYNKGGHTEIDVHVVWKDVKFSDRTDTKKLTHGLNKQMQELKHTGTGSSKVDVIDPSTSGKENWYCGMCSLLNPANLSKCKVCTTADMLAGSQCPQEMAWNCVKCGLRNIMQRLYCRLCGGQRLGEENQKQAPEKLPKVINEPIVKHTDPVVKPVKKVVDPEPTPPPVVEEKPVEEKVKKVEVFDYKVDKSKPTTRIKIKFPDRSEVFEFNLDDPVKVIENVVRLNVPIEKRSDVVVTRTYPPKPFDDKEMTIKDAGLANSSLVVRFG